MAGDWIKMRSGLLTNPKVIRMARSLASNKAFQEWWTRGTNQSCDETIYELCDVTVVTRVTVGSLLCVWSSANESANECGKVPGITLFEVDEMAGVPGFGQAMQLVGWAIETDEGVEFPNFNEHNTVGKQRSTSAKTGAERTKEWRERKKKERGSDGDVSDVTVTSQRDHREDKIREDIYIPPNPLEGGEGRAEEKPKRKRLPRTTLKTFISTCRDAGEKPISGYEPLLRYVGDTGLPMEFIQLAWEVFKGEFLPGGPNENRQQADWRKHFLNYVRKGYFRLWYAKPSGPDGAVEYLLTTQGLQAQAAMLKREAA